ncbi:hypothetical protein C8D92_102223 [Tamilnaduibacter salinus]|uniref:Uncharacterized protein n=1 Tax=Tamilnaduibacter salinus TaxID=1484056 RepID=A0A2U1CZI6_9GAMM|nr:hypothetical protein [Tamilnaduibacter salinus]PVY78183.1 hypothetical protein C8D92_102223 [Tamilnaduibacter salinus]
MIVDADKYTGVMYYVARDTDRAGGIPVSPFFSLPFEAKLWMYLWGDPEKYCVARQQFL